MAKISETQLLRMEAKLKEDSNDLVISGMWVSFDTANYSIFHPSHFNCSRLRKWLGLPPLQLKPEIVSAYWITRAPQDKETI